MFQQRFNKKTCWKEWNIKIPQCYKYDVECFLLLYNGVKPEVSMSEGWCGGGEGSKHFWLIYVHSIENVSSCDGATNPLSFAKCFWILGSWRQKNITYSFISPLDKRQTDRQRDRLGLGYEWRAHCLALEMFLPHQSLEQLLLAFARSDLCATLSTLPCLMSLWAIISWTG